MIGETVTRKELQIIGPCAQRLRWSFPGLWSDLKYQTQFGPEFGEYPYFPAAMNLQEAAQDLINGLDPDQKAALINFWRSIPRLIQIDSEEDILRRYAAVLIDELVCRARRAGRRSS